MSYDPTIGRWTQTDLIAFDGGDANLYRQVGNNPTNATDPTGLRGNPTAPVGTPGKNVPLPGFDDWVRNPVRRPFLPTKEELLGQVPTLRPRPAPPGSSMAPVGSGHHRLCPVIPPGTLVGPSGCGPCVGVVLVPEDTKRMPIYVYHFGAVDSPLLTIKWKGGGIPPHSGRGGSNYRPFARNGYRAILCGAEMRPADPAYNASALITLEDVLKSLRNQGIPIQGYVPSEGFGVDENGTPIWTTPKGYPTGGYDLKR